MEFKMNNALQIITNPSNIIDVEPSTCVRAQYIIILDYTTYQRAQNLINIGKTYLRAQSTCVHKIIKNI